MDDNNLECYICLDPISDNINANTYVLECCKNPVHLHCLQQWYNTNKNSANCFICNQYNSFCNDLIMPITDTSYIILPVNNESLEIPVTRPQTIINKFFYNIITGIGFILLLTGVGVVIVCIILF